MHHRLPHPPTLSFYPPITQPCCLCCTVSNSLIRLSLRTFALTVSSSWNTFPLDMCVAPLLHSGLPGNVTLSHKPYLRAAHLNSAPLPILYASLITVSDVIDSFVNMCLSLLEWGFLFVQFTAVSSVPRTVPNTQQVFCKYLFLIFF